MLHKRQSLPPALAVLKRYHR